MLTRVYRLRRKHWDSLSESFITRDAKILRKVEITCFFFSSKEVFSEIFVIQKSHVSRSEPPYE